MAPSSASLGTQLTYLVKEAIRDHPRSSRGNSGSSEVIKGKIRSMDAISRNQSQSVDVLEDPFDG